jgi:hypothetical protein
MTQTSNPPPVTPPASIAAYALYHVINLVFNNSPSITIPTKLNNSTNRFQHNINIKEVCNGIINPFTKETITKYIKLMDNPALKNLWVPAMSKELHCLAKGKKVSLLALTQFFISPTLKSGASQKIELSRMHVLSSTNAPKKTTQIKFESLLVATLLIICTNSPHIQLT